ncbi:MAG TPA: hypothetical protein VHF02_04085 [Luteimonas sp.]|nr:hypothetical protein [Luteimonas sp.]
MVRKILLPALAIAMLGGCVTSGYQYRGGNGDYYYGQPQVQYRDYGSPYGSMGYGYPGGWSGSFGFQHGYGGYGFPYGGYGGYGYPYGGYGGYGYPYGGYYDPYRHYYPRRPPVIVVRPPRHDDGHDNDGDHDGDHRGRDDGDRQPPWRDLGRLRQPGVAAPLQPQRSADATPSPRPPMQRSGSPDAGSIPRSSTREPGRDVRRKRIP